MITLSSFRTGNSLPLSGLSTWVDMVIPLAKLLEKTMEEMTNYMTTEIQHKWSLMVSQVKQ